MYELEVRHPMRARPTLAASSPAPSPPSPPPPSPPAALPARAQPAPAAAPALHAAGGALRPRAALGGGGGGGGRGHGVKHGRAGGRIVHDDARGGEQQQRGELLAQQQHVAHALLDCEDQSR